MANLSSTVIERQPTTGATTRRLIGELERILEPLWVGGAALALVLVGYWLLPLRGELLEWAIYGIVGVAFPALALLIAWAPQTARLGRGLKLLLALIALVAPLLLAPEVGDFGLWILALAQTTAAVLVGRLAPNEGAERPGVLRLALNLLAATIAWLVVLRIVTLETYNQRFFDGGWRLLTCILATMLVLGGIQWRPASPLGVRHLLRLVGHTIAATIFALMSFRVFPVLAGAHDIQLHWAAMLGSAEMVRHGAWLLWDMPSQYGFLNILLLQALPFQSVWVSFYMLNATLFCVTACILYALLRSLSPSFWNWCVALALPVAVLFLLPGPEGMGVYRWPGHSPYRFVWCYVLFGVVLLASRCDGRRLRALLCGGCLLWLIGALWSFESLIYCSAIWLPAYALLALQRASAFEGTARPLAIRLRHSLAWLALPPLLLGGSAALIALYYLAQLGHAPDWQGFYEYVLSFGGGFGALPITLRGGVWALVLVLVVLVTLAVPAVRQGEGAAMLAPLLGGFGAVWSSASYFVGRSAELSIRSLLPLSAAAAALALHAGRRAPATSYTRLSHALLVPLLALPLAFCYSNVEGVQRLLQEPQIAYSDVDLLAPQSGQSLAQLLAPMAQRGEPVQVLQFVNTDSLQTHGEAAAPHWLPLNPIVLFHPLPPERIRTYLARYAARTRASGWLVEPRSWDRTLDTPIGPYSFDWFYTYLSEAYRPSRVIENDEWRATWYEYIGPAR